MSVHYYMFVCRSVRVCVFDLSVRWVAGILRGVLSFPAQ